MGKLSRMSRNNIAFEVREVGQGGNTGKDTNQEIVFAQKTAEQKHQLKITDHILEETLDASDHNIQYTL